MPVWDHLAQYPLEGEEPIYAADASIWVRCDPECIIETHANQKLDCTIHYAILIGAAAELHMKTLIRLNHRFQPDSGDSQTSISEFSSTVSIMSYKHVYSFLQKYLIYVSA